jgi:hypothetical protein
VIFGGVNLDAEALHSIFFQNCLLLIGIAIHFITQNRFKARVSLCYTIVGWPSWRAN